VTSTSSSSSIAPASFAATPISARTRLDIDLEAAHLARAATHALHDELALYPKPGLVSFVDSGSHTDMTAQTFLRSIFALRDYFVQIAALGVAGAPFADLERLGIAAEQRMLEATGGINTHRGAVFTLGLVCAAAARPAVSTGIAFSPTLLRARLVERWGDALAARADRCDSSHGQRASPRHALRGAGQEAAAGFPALFDVAVPTLTSALRRGLDLRRAQLETFFALMAVLDDTNLVRRGGIDGLRHARRQARGFLAAGGADRPEAFAHAETIHREFVARRLSPGGSADLLAAACFVVRVGR
jgi:triphosphoribosyl-dephospho-CoA synthase